MAQEKADKEKALAKARATHLNQTIQFKTLLGFHGIPLTAMLRATLSQLLCQEEVGSPRALVVPCEVTAVIGRDVNLKRKQTLALKGRSSAGATTYVALQLIITQFLLKTTRMRRSCSRRRH